MLGEREDRPAHDDRSFPAVERPRRRAEFQSIYEKGEARHGEHLVVFLLRDSRIPRKAGIVAGRKVGKAVCRNRAKRLLREAYRHLRGRLPAEGIQLVLVARRGCDQAPFNVILSELEQLLTPDLLHPPTAGHGSS